VAHVLQLPPRTGHASPDATVLTFCLPGGADAGTARLGVTGALAGDVLQALTRLALSALRCGCAEIVVDVSGLTDFPTALFAELNTLERAARAYPGTLRLVGLDEAVAAVCRRSNGSDPAADPAGRSAQHAL
jgi:hypothetical protein